jgi:hypothetical protein
MSNAHVAVFFFFLKNNYLNKRGRYNLFEGQIEKPINIWQPHICILQSLVIKESFLKKYFLFYRLSSFFKILT